MGEPLNFKEKEYHYRNEVICKICGKSIYRIFVEHIENHLSYTDGKKVK